MNIDKHFWLKFLDNFRRDNYRSQPYSQFILSTLISMISFILIKSWQFKGVFSVDCVEEKIPSAVRSIEIFPATFHMMLCSLLCCASMWSDAFVFVCLSINCFNYRFLVPVQLEPDSVTDTWEAVSLWSRSREAISPLWATVPKSEAVSWKLVAASQAKEEAILPRRHQIKPTVSPRRRRRKSSLKSLGIRI